MNRRWFLQSGLLAGTALAGCVMAPDGGATPTPGASVEIVERDGLPAIPVEPAIDVVDPTASSAGPPEVRASLRNTGDYPVEVGEERSIVFAFVASEPTPGLVLVPIDSAPEPVSAGCWRLRDWIAIPEYYGIVRLEPGASTSRRLGVWASPEADGCLPTGRHSFQTQYAGGRDRTEDLDEQEWRGRWGFTLEVS